MKTIKTLTLALALATLGGCASTNYADYEVGEATISNLQVNEVYNMKKGQHKFAVSFDYEIAKYINKTGLYFCTLQFITINDTTMSLLKGKKQPCQLDKAKGEVSVSFPSIIDKSMIAYTSKEELNNLKYPMEYFIAIHQSTDKTISRIIGRSVTQVSKL